MDVVLGVVLGMVLAASLAAAWRLLRAPRRVLDPGGAAMQAAVHAATAILPHLRRGLSAESAAPAVAHLRVLTGASAVALTDGGVLLAFDGAGDDHHRAGDPVAGLIRAHRDARVHIESRLTCEHPDCPLRSAIVAPIMNRNEAVGAIVLFSETALAVSDRDRAIARHLGGLVSTEVMLGELDLHARATASAELAAMQAMIEPHFLFNALNTIAAFCRTQPDEARRLVLSFAEHCRLSLRRPHAFVPLRDELRHVEAYVALERARFGDQLEVIVRATPAAETALVPPLLVQPLVENAINHGKGDRPLRVVVRCDVRLGRLRITVRDNGRGIPRELADRVLEPGVGSGAAGLGLASAAQRVAVFYGEHGRLRIASAPRIGTLVSIVIPTVPPGHEQERLAQ